MISFILKDAMKIVGNHNVSFDEETTENLNNLENTNNILCIFKNKNFENCLDLNSMYILLITLDIY